MRSTIYKCDICHKKTNPNKLYQYNKTGFSILFSFPVQVDICTDCLEEFKKKSQEQIEHE